MDTTDTGRLQLEPFQRLLERCRSLSIPAWLVSADGQIIECPSLSEDADRWLQADEVVSAVYDVALRVRSERRMSPIAWDQGAWFIPLTTSPISRKATPVVVALAMERSASTSESFSDACKQVGMTIDQAVAALGSSLRATPIDAQELSTVLSWSMEDLSIAVRSDYAIEQFSEKLADAYEQVSFMFQFAKGMTTTEEPADLIMRLCHEMQGMLPFQWMSVALAPSNAASSPIGQQTFTSGHPPIEDREFEQLADLLVIEARQTPERVLRTPDECGKAKRFSSELIVKPIVHDGDVLGAILAGNKVDGEEVSSEELQIIDASAELLNVFHENVCRFNEQRDLFLGTLHALTASIDAKDRYTCGHSERVAFLAEQLAEAIGMSEEQRRVVRIAGQVHDVGKIGIPESVLCKTGRLTDEEYAIIKTHPVIGHTILKDIPPLEAMLPGVLFHHERWDGRGYPEGRVGEETPLLGRILACADAFDAMSSTRSYRPALPRERVLQEFKKCAGTQFDPELAPVFAALDFSEYDRLVEKHRAADVWAA